MRESPKAEIVLSHMNERSYSSCIIKTEQAMHTVKLKHQDIEVRLPAGSPLTELEFELHGTDTLLFGCKAGVCGACVIQVLDGRNCLGTKKIEERNFLETLGFPGDDFRLACQCHLNGAVTIQVVSQ
jgi:ferredoxin